MDENKSDDLVAFVLWVPVLKNDTEAAAGLAGALIPDPRAIQLWTFNPTLGDVLAKPIGVTASPAWDLFLVYPPQARWAADAPPPTPAYIMHNGEELPADHLFDAKKLSNEVRRLLQDSRSSVR